ncbi:AAA family ATPase, partial [Vibrio metschnikovii]|nr:AAA family ATPase [Vibrio metschnikovii]
MIPIEELRLKNFKSYKEQCFGFSNLTVFCGNNSVGKSTAIQALGILLQSGFGKSVNLNDKLVHVGNIDDIHNAYNRDEDELYIEVKSRGNFYKWGYNDADQREGLLGKNFLPYCSSNFMEAMELNDKVRGHFNYQYIVADRWGPKDNLPLSENVPHSLWLGTKGEYTAEVLDKILNRSNNSMSKFSIDEDPRRHEGTNSLFLFDNIVSWMGEVTPGYNLEPGTEPKANVSYNSIIHQSGKSIKAINTGFGYSYSMSIVVALLASSPGDLVIIENPEAHLHPKGQSYLGRLIALTAQAGVQVIVETHSDHLLNGIRVITRLKEDFAPELFTLYYISQGEQQSNVE